MKRTACLMSLVLVAGCAPLVITTSDVTPAGDSSFLVVAKPSDNTDWSDIQLTALKVANAYCAEQGKQMHQMNVETHGTVGWGQQSYALRFRCGT